MSEGVIRARVFLIDPHTFVRQAVRLLLTSTGQVLVVGDAPTFADALMWLSVWNEDPCILLVEPGPERAGLEEMFALHASFQCFPLVVVSAYWDEHVALDILERGASGYLLKSVDCAEMVRALEEVTSGGVYIDPRVSRDLIQAVRKQGTAPAPQPEGITARELDVLTLAAQGLNNRLIADRLSLSESTVKTHLRSIYAKLGVSDRTQAVLQGLRSGLITMAKPAVAAPTTA